MSTYSGNTEHKEPHIQLCLIIIIIVSIAYWVPILCQVPSILSYVFWITLCVDYFSSEKAEVRVIEWLGKGHKARKEQNQDSNITPQT